MNACETEDSELLRAYVETSSETAFAQLVQRHLNLVYSVAVRTVGDPTLAQDVCQEVFVQLARRAASIRNRNALPAWLYRVARALAANAVRETVRRRRREEEAMKSTGHYEVDESTWRDLRPLLEEGMGTLDDTDQAAVVLRFFAGKQLKEVGVALNLSEEAARKRVSRGVERLRSFFVRHGVQVSSPVLMSILATNTVQSAPAGLAAAVSTASLAGASAAGAAGVYSTIIPGIVMTKTSLTLIATVVICVSVTPLLLRKPTRDPEAAQSPAVSEPGNTAAGQTAAAVTPGVLAAQASRPTAKSVLERVATLPALTSDQIGTYVAQNKGNAESLLAAYRASANPAWLAQAAERFPKNPDVLYTVVASRAFPDSQQQWVDAYKTSAPDNALAWYFSALENFKAGKTEAAVADLAEATRKPTFRSEIAVTVQAVEELNLSAGRAPDEAKIAAFQTCAQFPELPQMRELARFMKEKNEDYKKQGDGASAEKLAGMGLALGAHLSEGSASQTLINQLVGMAVQKMFVQQMPPDSRDPFGRPASEVTKTIEQRQAALKEYTKMLTSLVSRLDDAEWAVYMERVKLYGEESALAWLKTKHGE